MNKGTPWYWTVVKVTRHIIFNLLGGSTVLGTENVPKTGSVILAPVHFSYLDPMIVGCTSPRALRFMAEDGLFKGLFGKFLRSVGTFPVRRGTSDKAAIQYALDQLIAGNALMIFPEGTRNDGKTLGKIQSGIVLFARKSNAQIVPIGISGPEKMFPKNQKKIKRGHTTIIYGEPFTYKQFEDSVGKKQAPQALLAHLESEILRLTAKAGTHLEVKTSSESSTQTSDPHFETPIENSHPQTESL